MENVFSKLFKPTDLTTGSILKKLIIFCIPVLLTSILSNAFGLINTLILKTTMNGDAVTSITATGSISSLLFNFGYGCSCGFNVITSNEYGKKDLEAVNKNLIRSLFLGIIIGLIIMIVGICSLDSLITILNIDEIYVEGARAYFQIVLGFFVFSIISNVLSNFFISTGNSAIPLLASLAGAVINALFAYILTAFTPLGVRGAGIASMISTTCTILLLLLFLKKKYKYIKFNLSYIKATKWEYFDLLKLGLPLGFQWSILFIGSFIQSIKVNEFGKFATKAAGCYGSFENYLTMPISVVSQGALAFVGQNYGSKNYDRIKKGIYICLLLDVFAYSISLIIGLTCKDLVPYIFLPAKEIDQAIGGDRIIYYCSTYLAVMTPFLICQGILTVSRSALMGIKKSIVPFLSGIGELCARAFVCYCFPGWVDPNNLLSDASYIAICFSNPLAWVASVLIMGGSVIGIIFLNKNFKGDHNEKQNSSPTSELSINDKK